MSGRDWTALVLAGSVGLSLLAFSIANAIRGKTLNADEITLVSTVAGAAIGAVATYLGLTHNGKEKRMNDQTQEPEVPESGIGGDFEAAPDAEPTGTDDVTEAKDEDELDGDADEVTEGMGPAPGDDVT